MIWRDVLVPNHIVESDGFTAEVGAALTTSLEVFCEWRRPAAGEQTLHRPATDGRAGGYDLVGEAGGVGPADSWAFAAAGVTFHVTEAVADPPQPGARLLVRGQLSVAERYFGEQFDTSFIVERIVRTQAGRAWDVRSVGRARPPGSHYVLTLAKG
ncbi:hypothetical protein [Actinoplanes sp. NPDC049316]|uniref:hypothetical protein n=1 Tax=Actinoplanes sp. NPDC049316 TaxID=3154727 RepID=UPI003439DA91